MFKDLHLSQDLMAHFKKLWIHDATADSTVQLEVSVCSAGYWSAATTWQAQLDWAYAP